MKKFLAIISAVVLTVSASMLPASAVSMDELPDSAQVVEVMDNGNGHTIYGLNDMLFSATWAGKSKLIIKNLTIAYSNIVHDPDDASKDIGVGAFVGLPQASTEVVLENCNLVNSRVQGGHWTGGLVGIAAGYSGNDGPVFEQLDILNCSVKGSTITGKGSCGAVIGHATASDRTLVTISGAVIENNTVASTGFAFTRAGSVIGTVGVAGLEKTVNGISHTGGTYVNAPQQSTTFSVTITVST